MKLNKKGLIFDILILVAPVAAMLLLMPVLPAKVPIHRGIGGTRTYIDRQYSRR